MKIHYAPGRRIACPARTTRLDVLADEALGSFLARDPAHRCARCDRVAAKHVELRAKKAAANA